MAGENPSQPATKATIWAMPTERFSKTLIRAKSAGPALTAAAAASCLPTDGHAIYTFPPGFFEVGDTLTIKASGKISSVITTPGTARFDVRIGAVVVFDGLAVLLDSVAAHNNVGWKLEIELQCQSVGSGTGTVFSGSGEWTSEDILGVPATAPKGVLTAELPWNTTPGNGTGFDTTATTNKLDLFFTQTVATGSLTLLKYSVKLN